MRIYPDSLIKIFKSLVAIAKLIIGETSINIVTSIRMNCDSFVVIHDSQPEAAKVR